jgi:hypothetical protein
VAESTADAGSTTAPDEPVATDPKPDRKVETREKRKAKQPSDKDLEGTPLDPNGVAPSDPIVVAASVVDNTSVELVIDGHEFTLTPDEAHNLALALSRAHIELVR